MDCYEALLTIDLQQSGFGSIAARLGVAALIAVLQAHEKKQLKLLFFSLLESNSIAKRLKHMNLTYSLSPSMVQFLPPSLNLPLEPFSNTLTSF